MPDFMRNRADSVRLICVNLWQVYALAVDLSNMLVQFILLLELCIRTVLLFILQILEEQPDDIKASNECSKTWTEIRQYDDE